MKNGGPLYKPDSLWGIQNEVFEKPIQHLAKNIDSMNTHSTMKTYSPVWNPITMKKKLPAIAWIAQSTLPSQAPSFKLFLAAGKSILFSLPFLFSGLFALAQSASPSVVNIAGQSATVGNFRFDWSVGESAAVTTMDNDKLIITNGLLQYNVDNQPEVNLVASFLPGEIRVYPNPVKNTLEINILHANKGGHQIELMDTKGNIVKELQLNYTGMGALEKWNLSGLPAGQYILNIRQTHPVNGRLVKKRAYKILKVN